MSSTPREPMKIAERSLLTTQEVSSLLGVDPSSVNNWVRSGKLVSYKTPGGHNRIEAATLCKFLDSNGMATPEALRDAARRRILVVDDDAKELRRWRRQLPTTHDRVQLRCVDNGIDALVQVGAFQPHLIVLDFVMPGLDGIDVCKRLQHMPELEGVAVVVVSASMTQDVMDRAVAAGARAAWNKPQSIRRFLELLDISPNT
ncbi:MAG: response regulator [Myxococcales bacterium]|nr:response regulator [Myxococcales bacterium]